METLVLGFLLFFSGYAKGIVGEPATAEERKAMPAASTLTDGDIVFTRYNADNDQFSFVFLSDVSASTEFFVTDEGWTGSGFYSNESTLKFVVNTAISAGEECHVNATALTYTTTSGASPLTLSTVGAFSPALGNMIGGFGDNLFIYQTGPSVIAGLSGDNGQSGSSGNAWFSASSESTAGSVIPSGKTNGTGGFLGLFPSGVNSEVDNARYKGSALHSGDKSAVLGEIMKLSNWEFDNNNAYSPATTPFNIAAAAPTSATVAISVFLEGAYNGTDLNTSLNASIPTTQVYTNNGHNGAESVGAIPANAVDWVLVELRETGSAAAALNATKVGSAAGFLMKDGSIKATDGTSNLTVQLTGNSGSDFYVVIYHRNHLPIMSASAISESGGLYTIDFTTVAANTYQNTTALVTLSTGKFAMPAGDADGDGDVDGTDLTTWRSQNGAAFVYNTTNGDFNLDGVINAVDRNDFQRKNSSKTSQVPTT